MEKTLSNVDKGTRQDLILRVISERELGTQQDVVAALSDIGVEVAQATVSRDLAELGVLKVRNRYLALPHEPGAAGIEVLPSFALAVTPAQNLVVVHTRDGTAGACGPDRGSRPVFRSHYRLRVRLLRFSVGSDLHRGRSRDSRAHRCLPGRPIRRF